MHRPYSLGCSILLRMQPSPPEAPLNYRLINQFALWVAVFLAGIAVLRLVNVLLLNETVKPAPLDGWLPMSLRVLAVLFVLAMLRVRSLRQRYLFILLTLLLLTSAGLWLRLSSRLPVDWQPAAGMAQLILSVCGLGLFIAGLAQGESLAGFIEETWLASSRAAIKSWLGKKGTTDDCPEKSLSQRRK